jgi:hypothetical protein
MNVCKGLALFFVVTLSFFSLAGVESAFAQTLTKPSAPEFTVKYVDHSTDTPPTYTTDPYTGKTVQNGGGHHENKTIDLTIKNQPFASSFNGTTYELYYAVRVKGHFSSDWETQVIAGQLPGSFRTLENCVIQSDSQYTVISLWQQLYDAYPAGSQIDYRVQAILGHNGSVFVVDHALYLPFPENGHYEAGFVIDLTSDWSSTQTVTIPTPPIWEQQPLLLPSIIAAAAIILIAGALLMLRKKRSAKKAQQARSSLQPAS